MYIFQLKNRKNLLGELILIHLKRALDIYSLSIQQSDWSECYNHGTINETLLMELKLLTVEPLIHVQ